MLEDADNKSRGTIGAIGVVITVAGLGIVSPGPKDVILSALSKRFELNLYLNAPPWAGALLIVGGVVLLTLAFFGQSRLERGSAWLFGRRGATNGSFLAVKHVGFAPVVRDIHRGELPSTSAKRDLKHLQVDLSTELAGARPSLENDHVVR